MFTETFIRCLKHLATRRGMPQKTFKAVAKFLKMVFKDEEIVDYLAGIGIEWVFNIERVPRGGAEYLIRW